MSLWCSWCARLSEEQKVSVRFRRGTLMEEEKESLIDLIIWYRDEYHKSDWCHTELIQKVNEAKTEK